MVPPSPGGIHQVEQSHLTLAELEQALEAADSAALLVSPRLLRRVIKQHAGVRTLGLRVPHRKTYVITRAALSEIIDLDELGLAHGRKLPDSVILIARPGPEVLESLSTAEVLRKHWRLLFHARVHQTLDQRAQAGMLSPEVAGHRIAQIGQTEFDEVRFVLKQEDYLLSPDDDLATYIEFAAVFLELKAFCESFLACYFPAIQDYEHVGDVLGQDIDGARLLEATRLPGTPDPQRPVNGVQGPAAEAPLTSESTSAETPTRSWRKTLLKRAKRAAAVGNVVRSAILRTVATRRTGGNAVNESPPGAMDDLALFAGRLQRALKLSEAEVEDCRTSLAPLLEPAARGFWTAEARLLYDLQKVCLDHERGVYALDLARWIMSFGRAPLKRPLPGQRDVLISKHLHSAARRLSSARISGRARIRLAALLQSAVHRAEGHLRTKFRATMNATLDEVQLAPRNLPERIAREKLIEELLDRIVERGFLMMGDLRDALSRNNLKLPDLSKAEQIVSGDELFRADRLLAERLDGIYRRGEIYLRLPQKLSSLAFGTPIGRLFTRFVALPFGTAFVALVAAKELIEAVMRHLMHQVPPEWVKHLDDQNPVLSLGVFLLLVFQHRGFRNLCRWLLRGVGRGLRAVLWDAPKRLFALPAVREILDSSYFRLLTRYLFKPLALSILIGAPLAFWLNVQASVEGCLGVFVGVNVLLNSRWGRGVDELITDWFAHAWHRLRIHIFAAIFRFVIDLFHQILEGIERLLYTVDEGLRFRSGETPATTAIKTTLGIGWSVVNYVIRLCVTLLIEPQVNPIKHFPVVTVSHKIIWLYGVPVFVDFLEPILGKVWAGSVAFTTGLLLPGICGFLVWELKENWRLYAENRPRDLQPVTVGSHGETTLQLMKPGFHSGRLPKLYARLRRASRKAYWTGNWKAVHKSHDALHHVERDVRRFVERELANLLIHSKGWGGAQITTGEILLAGNRILVELYSPELAEDSLWVAFEEQSGWLVAGVWKRGWLDQVTLQQRHTLATALAGFYKMAGVDLVREQIESKCSAPYAITESGIVVCNNGQAEAAPSVSFTNSGEPAPPWIDARAAQGMDPRQIMFAATAISWRTWVIVWELDLVSGGSQQRILEDISLLPGETVHGN